MVGMLTGCAHVPDANEIAHADYGSYPSDYVSIVKSYFATAAVDPDSVEYRQIVPPVAQMWGDRIGGAHFDYNVCVTYNAKNRMGGYVGYKTDAVMIHNGAVRQVLPNGEWFGHQFC
jgi:hypothetical protein